MGSCHHWKSIFLTYICVSARMSRPGVYWKKQDTRRCICNYYCIFIFRWRMIICTCFWFTEYCKTVQGQNCLIYSKLASIHLHAYLEYLFMSSKYSNNIGCFRQIWRCWNVSWWAAKLIFFSNCDVSGRLHGISSRYIADKYKLFS